MCRLHIYIYIYTVYYIQSTGLNRHSKTLRVHESLQGRCGDSAGGCPSSLGEAPHPWTSAACKDARLSKKNLSTL